MEEEEEIPITGRFWYKESNIHTVMSMLILIRLMGLSIRQDVLYLIFFEFLCVIVGSLIERFEAHMEVHFGSVDKEDDEQGIAHMIEHVAFLGSKKGKKLLGTGARSNAYTDFHHTVFHIHSPSSSKIAFYPKFIVLRVEKERRANLSELLIMITIEYRVDCQLLQRLHSENKLSRRFPIGLEEQIKKWDAGKIRKFLEHWYFTANANLYIVNITKAVYQIESVSEGTHEANETASVPSPRFWCDG